MSSVCKFRLPEGTDRRFIEDSLASAAFNAECVFGKPRMMIIGLAYYVADDNRQCVIDVSSEVGEHIARVFTGILINVLGEEGFSVHRIEGALTGKAGE